MPVKHLLVGSLALNDTVYADGRTSMAAPGGNALYAAVGANLWSRHTAIVAVVGHDWPAEYTATLSQSHINTDGLVYKNAETMRAWTVYEHNGYRRYFSRNSEMVPLTPSPYSSAPIKPEDVAAYSEAARKIHIRCSPLPQELPEHLWPHINSIHLCPMRLETILAWTDFLQDKPDIFVSVDILPYPLHGNLDDPHLRQLLRRVNAFLPSDLEAESLLPGYHPETFCREIAARGPAVVVVKNGSHGAAIFDREQNLFRKIAPYPAHVTDLTGAGDSFCGGFSIGYTRTRNVIQATLYGTATASFIIEGFGGLHALNIPQSQAQQRLAELQQKQEG